MTPGELKRRLDEGEPLVVLDVREEDERAWCAIPVPATASDIHVPMTQIPTQGAAVQGLAEMGQVVVYCHLGMRSMVVARWLAARGVGAVANLEGGIDAWSTEVDPALPRY